MASVFLVAAVQAQTTNVILLALAAAVGNYIDNKYLFVSDVDTPEQESLDLQNTTEGGPALGLIGQECRVRGQVIFMGPAQIVEKEDVVDLAIAISNDGVAIDSVTRIYAEGYDVYNGSGVATTGARTDIELTSVFIRPKIRVGYLYSKFISPPLGFDMTRFRAIAPALHTFVTSGWFYNENNWSPPTHKNAYIFKTVRLPDGRTEIWAHNGNPKGGPFFPVDEPAGRSVTLTQTFDPLNKEFATSAAIHKGLAGQLRDLTISNFEVNAPAFNGTAYAYLKQFRLTEFGRRVPDVTFIVRQSATPVTIAQAIDAIYERAGWVKGSSKTWDTSSLDPLKIVTGYTMREEGSIQERLRPLLYAFDVNSQNRDGTTYFYHTESFRSVPVHESQWGAAVGEPDEEGLRFNPPSEIAMPSSVTVHYVDRNTEWEDAAAERHVSSAGTRSRDDLSIDLRSLTMTYTQAFAIATRLLWEPRRLRNSWSGSLSQAFWNILEGDVIATTSNGNAINLLVTKIDIGADRTVKLEGRVYEPPPPLLEGVA